MSRIRRNIPRLVSWLALAVLLAGSGCHSVQPTQTYLPIENMMPRELSKVVLPPYTIEPPDILTIDAVHIVPRSPYRVRALDVLAIEVREAPDRLKPGDALVVQVPEALSDMPIDGPYVVGPVGRVHLGFHYGSVEVRGLTVDEAKQRIAQHLEGLPAGAIRNPTVSTFLAQSAPPPITGNYQVQMGGEVDLGVPYGPVQVAGKTVSEAKEAIRQHLTEFFAEPEISVTLAQSAAQQQISGQHLVCPDGTVTLGSYGSVSVVGLTLAQAKLAIEHHLSQFLEDPEVAVDVWAYNSKKYYVITQGAGLGDGVYPFPITGNETVLDAISQVNGLQYVSSKRIWVARPTPEPGNVQILPVNWHAITAQASASTNYQLLPGDRVFIAEDKLIAFDMHLSKLITPVERIMAFTLFGTGTVSRLTGNVLGGGGVGGFGGFGGF